MEDEKEEKNVKQGILLRHKRKLVTLENSHRKQQKRKKNQSEIIRNK